MVLAAAQFCLGSAPLSRPATRPSRAREARKYPTRRLLEACRRGADTLRKRLDRTFTIRVLPPFVVAGNLPATRLNACAQHSVVRPAKAMWASYFRKKPDQVITVLLFKDQKTYRAWAKRLFGDTDLPHFGYYKPGRRTMVMDISTGTGTLVHELTHALIVYDFPDAPTWFNEALGTLHEQCTVLEDRIVGADTNWRLPALRQVIAKGTLRPLRDLVTKRDFYGRLSGLNYAQVRYFIRYTQRQGLLKKLYAHFRDHHTGPDADVKAIEHVYGKKIEAVEKDFIKWVKPLRYR